MIRLSSLAAAIACTAAVTLSAMAPSGAAAQGIKHTPQEIRSLVFNAFENYHTVYCPKQRRMSTTACRESTKPLAFAGKGDVSFVYQWWPILDDTYPETWGERQSIWIKVSEPIRYGVNDNREEEWMYRLEQLYPKKSRIASQMMLREPMTMAVYKAKVHPNGAVGPEYLVLGNDFKWVRHNNVGLNELVEHLENINAGRF